LAGGLGLAGSENLRSGLGHFTLQFIKFFLNNVFVVGKVGLQPLESSGVVFGFKVTLKFI
jgi:hypothetical protein